MLLSSSELEEQSQPFQPCSAHRMRPIMAGCNGWTNITGTRISLIQADNSMSDTRPSMAACAHTDLKERRDVTNQGGTLIVAPK